MIEKGVEFETINYIEEPLSASGLRDLLKKAGLKASDILRTKEEAYREHVAGKNLSDKELLAVMAAHPELIQRPIVVRGGKAVLARPVARLNELGIED